MICRLHHVFVSEANFDVLLHLGKVVTLRDLTNIATNLWLKTDSHGIDLQDVISKRRQDLSITIDGFIDKGHNLLDILYQDKTMKDTFQAFPEMLFIYATHKLNSLRMSLYVFLIQN